MKSAHAIRFVHFEDLGTFGAALENSGYAIRYADAGKDDINALDPLRPDLLICLGGPIGAYEENIYPVLKPVMQVIERRIAAGLPTMGICLGAQIIARVLGARVYQGEHKEIGWSALRLTESGRRGCLRHLGPESTPVLHWHGDTFDLPGGASLLASSRLYENQAFAFGHNVLGLQFHPEVTAAGLERWYIGHACEIAATPDVKVPALRAASEQFAPALKQAAQRLVVEWLDGLDGKREGSTVYDGTATPQH